MADGAAELKGTQRLYNSLWTKQSSESVQRVVAIASSLDMLAKLLDGKTTSTIAIGYDATLEDPSESVQRVVAIASSLDMLAKLLDRKTTSTIAIGYDATLEDPSESVQRVVAIASSLDMLAKLLDRKTTSTIAIGYDATLEDLTQEEIVLAFSRAHDECKFFPSPATLREFSGRPVTGDPIANEAKEGLLSIIAAMRGPHGPMLRDIPGRILYGTEDCPRDAEGKLAHLPIREPGTPFLLSRRLSDALVRLGWGDRSAGIAVIADHPAVSKRRQDPDDDDQYKRNQLRAADEILKRFTDAYREV